MRLSETDRLWLDSGSPPGMFAKPARNGIVVVSVSSCPITPPSGCRLDVLFSDAAVTVQALIDPAAIKVCPAVQFRFPAFVGPRPTVRYCSSSGAETQVIVSVAVTANSDSDVVQLLSLPKFAKGLLMHRVKRLGGGSAYTVSMMCRG